MIVSFGNRDTERIWFGMGLRKLSHDLNKKARIKLRLINNAKSIDELKIPPGNRLEKLKGDLDQFYSIRVNRQWRLIFIWEDNDAYQVTLIDYH